MRLQSRIFGAAFVTAFCFACGSDPSGDGASTGGKAGTGGNKGGTGGKSSSGGSSGTGNTGGTPAGGGAGGTGGASGGAAGAGGAAGSAAGGSAGASGGSAGSSTGGSSGAAGGSGGATGGSGGSIGGTGGSTGGTGGSTGGTGGNNTPEAARYALELVSPRAAGSTPATGSPAMPTGHRIFKAYPGLEYNIRAVVIGGSYPYTYALSNAPSGMTINANTGVIAWPNPSGSTATPTITVTDTLGTTLSSPWTINVTTSGFRFVDAVNGADTNTGTLTSPWRSISKIKSSGSPGDVVIFRAGTYRTTGMATSGADTWVRVEFNGAYQPVQWVAYPGETPVIDNDYVAGQSNGRFIRLSGSNTYPVYLDGFEITHSYDKGLQFGSGSCDYPVFRRLNIHDIAQAIDGSNSAGIMTLSSYSDPSWYAAYQNIDFHHNAPGGIKQYSHKKLLWEDLTFRDSGGGPDLKSHVPRFEVRRTAYYNVTGNYCGLFGNMAGGAGGVGEAASGEIRYNRMMCGDSPTKWAMDVNQDGQAAEIFLYRNTFVGTVRVRNTDGSDGPFHFDRNVIVNSNSGTDHITLENVSAPAQVQYVQNLSGAPSAGIVDANGNLAGSYMSYVGSRGHQIP